MSESTRNSRQSGEHACADAHDDARLERVPPRDYVVAVALTVGLILAIVYLGGTVE